MTSFHIRDFFGFSFFRMIGCILFSSLAPAVVAGETAPSAAQAGETPAETPAETNKSVQGRVKYPYRRYQSIVDRQMFGPLPPGFDPEKLPSEVSRSAAGSEKELTQEQEKLQSSIHFSMINVTPDGSTVVGFTDNSDPKVPVPMYLKVGEERNGWKVLEADPTTATMRISKGDIEVSLTIGGNSASAAGATSKTSLSAAQAAAGRGRPAGGARPGGLLGSTSSLRARRAARQQAAAAAAAEMQKRQEAEKAEREAERAAREEEKARDAAEREEQRRQLESIKEELKKAREAKAEEESRKEEKAEDENNAAD